MAVLSAIPISDTGAIVLSSGQTGNGDSTNTLDRGFTLAGPMNLAIVATVGAAPTVTINIMGSMDGADFYNVAYALIATPTTKTVAAIVITSASDNHYVIHNDVPWRFLKLVYTLNNNVTIVAAQAFPVFGA